MKESFNVGDRVVLEDIGMKGEIISITSIPISILNSLEISEEDTLTTMYKIKISDYEYITLNDESMLSHIKPERVSE